MSIIFALVSNYKNLINLHGKIFRFDVSVNDALAVDALNPGDDLICYHKDRFKLESPRAEVEEFLEVWT